MNGTTVAEAASIKEVKLNHHQIAILQWVAHGKRNDEIALLMDIERPQNVQAHLQRIMDATGTSSRAAAVAWALRRNIIE